MNTKCEKFGSNVDNATIKRDLAALKSLIAESANILEQELSNNELAYMHYCIGNAWGAIDDIENRSTFWLFGRDAYEKSIISFRRCVATAKCDNAATKGYVARALTNLGNAFSRAGRPIAAINYWKQALLYNPNYGMAVGNLGYGILYYSRLLYDKGHQIITAKYARRNLLSAISSQDLFPEALATFESSLEFIERCIPEDLLNDPLDFNEIETEFSRTELDYINWCTSENLYLNPLNDILRNIGVSHDVLSLPPMIATRSMPVFHALFNQIKQEYISLRYFYYLSKMLKEENRHFSDNGRHLTDTLDYSVFGLKYEYLKASFKNAYSILDKIAYFLNAYFCLKISERKIYFRTIWHEKQDLKKPLAEKFLKLSNLPLQGLYYLSKDLLDGSGEYFETLDPDAKSLSLLRNSLEHKHVSIHLHSSGYNKDNEFGLDIVQSDMYEKTLKLIKIAREAIIYLSLSINCSENENQSDGIIGSIPLPEFDR